MTIAAHKNYPELLDTLLSAPKINVNLGTTAAWSESDDGSRTPLMIASFMGHNEIVKKLLEREEIDISVKDKLGFSAVHYAAYNCPLATKLFAQVPGIDWNDKTNDGYTPLYCGLFVGLDEVVKTIISLPNIDFNAKNIFEETLASRCVKNDEGNDLKCLELLTSIPDVDWNIPDEDGDTPILWCIKNKQIRKFIMLLRCSGFDFNIQKEKLEKIIYALFHHQKIDIIQHLTENNAETNTFEIMLSVAAMLGHLNAVKSLVGYGSTDQQINAKGFFWDFFSRKSTMKAPKSLDLNKRDKNGNTPVDYAILGGHLEVAKFLIENGADENLLSVAGKLFMASCKENNSKIVMECIFDVGVNVNMISEDGFWSGKAHAIKFNYYMALTFREGLKKVIFITLGSDPSPPRK